MMRTIHGLIVNGRRLGFALCPAVFLSLLFSACQESKPSAQASLRKLGYHFTVDHYLRAADAGDSLAVERFLAYQMPVDQPGPDGDSALIRAAAAGRIEAVAFLLDAGAKVDFRGAHGRTSLHRAA